MSRRCRDTNPEAAGIFVWLSPAQGESVTDFAADLSQRFHLVVIPKTGSRRADVAVLTDPDPAELESVARILPGTPLIATTTHAPTAALVLASRRTGAQLLTRPSVTKMACAITAQYAAHHGGALTSAHSKLRSCS